MSSQLKHLEFAANRASHDNSFIAYFLYKYQEIESIEESKLIKKLDCTKENYFRLALCGSPNLNDPEFSERIKKIALFTEVSALELALIIKRVVVVTQFQSSEKANNTNSILTAARDRDSSKGSDTNKTE